MTDAPLPYGRQCIDDDDIAAVVEVLKSDWLTTGPAVERFEAALEAHVGAPCLAVNSGTAALHASYAAAGLGPGAELITTPMTFAATATAALHLGADVVFADVSEDTLNLDPEAVAAAVTPRTRAICAVDFAGHPADLDQLRAIADSAGVTLIEDAAHSIGAHYRGRPVGSVADLTTFSFHPVKTITTAEGGAVAVVEARFFEPIRRFRSHGLVRETSGLHRPEEGGWHQEVQELGLNYRTPDVLAALGWSQLRKLEAFVARRAELVARYRDLLRGLADLRLPTQRADVEPAWHLFAVRVPVDLRRHVFDELRRAGIGAQVHYLPVHLHPLFAERGFAEGAAPVAEEAYRGLISLPLHPGLTDADQDRVVHALRSALGH